MSPLLNDDRVSVSVVWSMWHERDLLRSAAPDMSSRLQAQGKRLVTDATITVPRPDNTAEFLEAIFEATNLYTGPLWTLLEPVLPPERTHTALSPGDYVVIDGQSWRCDAIGWTQTARPANA